VSLILEGRVNYDAPIWADEYAKDFVENLLVANPKQRMTAAIAGRHAWIRNREIMPDEEPSIEILGKVGHCLRQYKYVSDLKKIALNAIAHKSTSAQVSELRKVFSKLDAKREGILSVQVFEEQLRRVFCFSPEDIEEIRSSIVSLSMMHDGNALTS
jgi:calcium-dependent protein kinase